LAQRGREDDDFAAYIYKSVDYGKTFTSIVNNIPAGPVNVIREHPTNPNILFVGTDFGVFVSTNGGAKWDVLGNNLPSTQVSDLQYHALDKVLVISTYGRGMYAMDVSGIRCGSAVRGEDVPIRALPGRASSTAPGPEPDPSSGFGRPSKTVNFAPSNRASPSSVPIQR